MATDAGRYVPVDRQEMMATFVEAGIPIEKVIVIWPLLIAFVEHWLRTRKDADLGPGTIADPEDWGKAFADDWRQEMEGNA